MASVATIYLASILERATTGYNDALQLIVFPLAKKMYSVKDFYLSRSPLRSISTYLTVQLPMLFHFRYNSSTFVEYLKYLKVYHTAT